MRPYTVQAWQAPIIIECFQPLNKTYMKIELTGLPMMLFIVFLILRLCKVIAWSWWWVTSPLWISFVLIAISCILYIINYAVISARKYRKK